VKRIILRHEEQDAIVIGNFGLNEQDFAPGFTSVGKWHEVFTGDSIMISDIDTNVSLNPGEYRIYTNKKMESIISRTDSRLDVKRVSIYPNPAEDNIFISTEFPVNNIEVFNITGSKVILQSTVGNHLDISHLPKGFYILRIDSGKEMLTGSFIKR
jgi:hypothetical protein